MRQIVLDTETTGLSPEKGHRIIEIGCLEMINRRLTGNHLHYYINPECDIEQSAIDVHGLTSGFLADKPLFKDIAEEIVAYLKDSELVIHNAPFDVGFLNHELKQIGSAFQPIMKHCSVVDTLVMARRKHPGQPNNLNALCRRYEVDNSNRELHGALLDAELLAQVYLLMTGGQTQLFNSVQTVEVTQQADVRRVAPDRVSLPVIAANEEELKAHQAFLQMLDETKNGGTA